MPSSALKVQQTRAYLDDLTLDPRHRPLSSRAPQPTIRLSAPGRTDLARARLFSKPDESRTPFEHFGSFARRDRARGEELVQERVELRVQKAGRLWSLDRRPAEHRCNLR
jgi:hypothetical protein